MLYYGYKNTETGKINGPGIGLYEQDGLVYVGEWKDGYYEGQGLMQLGTEFYEGQFSKNSFNG